jgi:putative PIN family toxin of toxin-antitoxin system
VTLDANVLAPGFASRGGASARIIDFWHAKRFELVMSEHLLLELASALSDPYYRRFVPAGEAAAILTRLARVATVVLPSIEVRGVATHPEDDLVLSTALSGNATILCTRDKQLLKLGAYQTVTIFSPGELLTILEAEE